MLNRNQNKHISIRILKFVDSQQYNVFKNSSPMLRFISIRKFPKNWSNFWKLSYSLQQKYAQQFVSKSRVSFLTKLFFCRKQFHNDAFHLYSDFVALFWCQTLEGVYFAMFYKNYWSKWLTFGINSQIYSFPTKQIKPI